MKNNKNKAKLIINNKKYALKEFINQKGSSSDEIKINILLNKDLLNISSFFKNCFKLIEFSFKDNILLMKESKTLKKILVAKLIIMKIYIVAYIII